MTRCNIDHLVITAPTLAAGAEFVAQSLGVTAQTGGEHPRMGTHNLLLRLGDSLYLEVIAPNPKASPPERPRWFGLDNLRLDTQPALTTWVARTSDIRATAAKSYEPLGEIEAMSRGTLNWLITIPADGTVPLDGVAPALIEWQTEFHPAEKMPNQGLSLELLEIFHPEPSRVSCLLSFIGLTEQFSVLPTIGGAAPHLVAHINTPQGLRRLSI